MTLHESSGLRDCPRVLRGAWQELRDWGAHPKTYPQIDLGKCCFCGLCQDVCPTGAMTLTQNVFLSTNDPATALRPPFQDEPAD